VKECEGNLLFPTGPGERKRDNLSSVPSERGKGEKKRGGKPDWSDDAAYFGRTPPPKD